MSSTHSSYEIRCKAIDAINAGNSITHVSQLYGYSRNTINRWRQRYAKESTFDSLKRKEGSGRPRLLKSKQLPKIEKIVKSAATDYGYETDLWTCTRLINIINKELKQKISQPTMWRRLREANLTYKKPEQRFSEQNEKKKKLWLKNELPKILETVDKYRAILYFEDEARISLSPILGKTWSPKGQTPVIKVTGGRGSISAISAISKSGHLIFKLHDKNICSNEIIDFLTQMLDHHPRRHLVILMDQASCHVSKKTKAFIDSKKRLHVFYIPPYSPELNADEKVWNHLKHQELKSHTAKDKKELKKITNKKLRAMAKDSKLIKCIFFRSYVSIFLN